MKKFLFIFFFGFFSFFSVSSVLAQTLENYCTGGYYVIPGEKKCSRAPGCGGYTYDDLNKDSLMMDHDYCLGQGVVIGNPSTRPEEGYFPLCCYEMERTGDYTKCIGYWERLWCASSQCKNAAKNGASDSQCGGDCQCATSSEGHGLQDVQPVPLSQRLNSSTVTPTPFDNRMYFDPSPVSPGQSLVITLTTALTCSAYTDFQGGTGVTNCVETVDGICNDSAHPNPKDQNACWWQYTCTTINTAGTYTATFTGGNTSACNTSGNYQVGNGGVTSTPTPSPTTSPNVTSSPTPTTVLTCSARQKTGDYDCNGTVNTSDYDNWKADFLLNKSTLSFFEYWRRASF